MTIRQVAGGFLFVLVLWLAGVIGQRCAKRGKDEVKSA
jgi:hypothetical protein